MTPALLHAAATWSMVGLIWFVQVVHYPLFAAVGSESFVGYEAGHTRRVSMLVALPAVTEVASAAWLFLAPPAGLGRAFPLAGGMLLVAAWVTTVVVQVPLHERLGRGHDDATIRALVRSNWIRTGLWSARGVLALVAVGAIA